MFGLWHWLLDGGGSIRNSTDECRTCHSLFCLQRGGRCTVLKWRGNKVTWMCFQEDIIYQAAVFLKLLKRSLCVVFFFFFTFGPICYFNDGCSCYTEFNSEVILHSSNPCEWMLWSQTALNTQLHFCYCWLSLISGTYLWVWAKKPYPLIRSEQPIRRGTREKTAYFR